METTPITVNPNKSTFWKAGMVIASYFVVLIPASLILGTIRLAVFIRSGQPLTNIQNINEGIFSYFYVLIILIIGLLGIRYGIRYVARKSLLTKNDVSKIIIWFIIVDLILLLLSTFRGIAITYFPFVSLVINCLAIFFFSKNLINNKNTSS